MKLGKAIRQHWDMESQLHWVLNIVFGDDHSRIRKTNASRNIVIVKKAMLNLLRMINNYRFLIKPI